MTMKTVQFGVFIPVGNGGWIMSTTSPQLESTYAYNKEVTQLAEQLGFDFALSMAKWRGFGGPSRHWDYTLESFTAMAALAECTDRIKLWATLHTMVWHPAVIAKMFATFDQVSSGRAGINLVAGSNPTDQGQMGLWRDLDHSQRYELAEEWITVAKRLWTEDRVTHSGTFFNLEDCMSYPKPTKIPPILCAGTSDTGFRFTITNCDYCFMGATGAGEMIRVGQRAKALGRELGKQAKTMGLFMVVPGRTDLEAHERVDHYNEGVDLEALANRTLEYSADVNTGNNTAKRMVDAGERRLAVSPSAIVGTPDTIADQLAQIVHDGDLDGVVVIMPDFINDLGVIGEQVLPRLADRGVVGEHLTMAGAAS